MRVLAIDDSVTIRRTIQSILEKAGHSVITFGSCDEARPFLASLERDENIVDVVTLNLTMPGTRGDHFCKEIRDSKALYNRQAFALSKLPLIAITSHDSLLWRSRVRRSGFDSYLSKPFTREEICDEVPAVVVEWRSRIVQELEVFALSVDVKEDNDTHISWAGRFTPSRVQSALSKQFVERQKALPFIRMSEQLFDLTDALQELKLLVSQAARKSSVAEARFQKFFERYPELLEPDPFRRVHPHPTIRVNDGCILRPDFLAEPATDKGRGRNWRITELKLPSDRLVVSSSFHRRLTARFIQALMQVVDYRKTLAARGSLKTGRGIVLVPGGVRCSILIGRSREYLAHNDLISERMRDMGVSDVEVVTYDEVLDRAQRQLDLLLGLPPPEWEASL